MDNEYLYLGALTYPELKTLKAERDRYKAALEAISLNNARDYNEPTSKEIALTALNNKKEG